MRKYILHSTLIAVFSESLRIHTASIDLKFFYIIVLFNFALIAAVKKRLFLPKFSGIFFAYLLFSALFTYLFYNTIKGYFQLGGILICSLYFFNFFNYIGEKYLEHVFKLYLKYVMIVCVFGLVSYPIIKFILGPPNYRLSSILGEPAHFAAIVLPGYFYYLKNFSKSKAKVILISLSLLLSASSLAYIGIALALLLLSKGNKAFRNIGLSFMVLLLGYGAYLTVPQIKLRVDDTLGSIISYDVEGVNASTYALISNLYVTEQVFLSNPIFGGGLGSHPSNHAIYVRDLPGFSYYLKRDSGNLASLNSEDANSLFLRVVSELGLFGLLLVIVLIKKHYTRNGIGGNTLSRGVLIYFFYKLLREGNYFPPEMYFFVGLYYYNSRYEKFLLQNENNI